jgi:very-short-patch-repair endonuclease
MIIVHYKKELKLLASHLRNESTQSEICLWKYLKGKQLNYRFARQKPIGNYIVDFYCREKRLAIELDGYSHRFEETIERDEQKEKYLNNQGICVLRFQDAEVMENIDNVIAEITCALRDTEEG